MTIVRTTSRSLLALAFAGALSFSPLYADGNDAPVAVTADGEKTLYSDSSIASGTESGITHFPHVPHFSCLIFEK